MKKLLPLLFLFIVQSLTAQNGFTTYSATLPAGPMGLVDALLIDNAGNKWVAYSAATPTAGAALGFYNASANTWTFFNKGNTPNLPANGVKCLAQDNSGNIWMGTSLGLVKYDGTSFTVFTTTNGLPHNSILSLENINNMLYIGTANGLSRYDGITFTNYTTANTLFPFNAVTCLKAENANTIWAGCGTNLVKFSINSSFTSTSYTTSALTNTCSILSLYIDAAANKWLGTTIGIVKYDNTNFYSVNSLYPNFVGCDLNLNVNDITKGPNNGVLFVSSYNAYPAGTNRCIVELLPGGAYNLFYPSPGLNIGNYIKPDLSGKIFIAGWTGGGISKIFSFDKSGYNPFGQGPGGGVNSSNFKYLDINRVTAGIMNRGDMWTDIAKGEQLSYEVPNGNPPNAGVHSAYTAALWMGGLDGSGQLHTSAQTYRQAGNDFWPGPLDTINATTDTAHVIQYDKIWKVSYNDINTFITQFNLGNVPTSYTPTPDILTWPATGTGINTRNMAPFVDINGNGIYDPMVGGDYPKIKGDETLYYIFNDNFTSHGQTNGIPLGVEVHAMAYAYGCPTSLAGRNELAYTTFYNYKIHNRSNNNYNNVFIGFWNEVDIGCYQDDYIGSDPDQHLGFCYNSTAADKISCSGENAYGNYPPAAGATILKSPLANANDGIDNDHDGLTDEPGEELGLTVFDYFNNNIGAFNLSSTYPTTKYHYYNYLMGQWKDSTYFTCGGNAYGGTTPTKYVYPWNNYIGNPCGSGTWSEASAGNLAGDRKYLVSSGPFNLAAKQMTEYEFAYVWSVDSSATNNVNIASVNKLLSDVGKIRSFYSGASSNCLLSINIGIKEEHELSSELTLFPNPGNYLINIKADHFIKNISVMDISGRTVITKENINEIHTELNVESLAGGVYFVKVSGNGWSNTRKLVKN